MVSQSCEILLRVAFTGVPEFSIINSISRTANFRFFAKGGLIFWFNSVLPEDIFTFGSNYGSAEKI